MFPRDASGYRYSKKIIEHVNHVPQYSIDGENSVLNIGTELRPRQGEGGLSIRGWANGERGAMIILSSITVYGATSRNDRF